MKLAHETTGSINSASTLEIDLNFSVESTGDAHLTPRALSRGVYSSERWMRRDKDTFL